MPFPHYIRSWKVFSEGILFLETDFINDSYVTALIIENLEIKEKRFGENFFREIFRVSSLVKIFYLLTTVSSKLLEFQMILILDPEFWNFILK